jgi:hypothetical protein
MGLRTNTVLVSTGYKNAYYFQLPDEKKKLFSYNSEIQLRETLFPSQVVVIENAPLINDF